LILLFISFFLNLLSLVLFLILQRSSLNTSLTLKLRILNSKSQEWDRGSLVSLSFFWINSIQSVLFRIWFRFDCYWFCAQIERGILFTTEIRARTASICCEQNTGIFRSSVGYISVERNMLSSHNFVLIVYAGRGG
jgi:hypothetical protein